MTRFQKDFFFFDFGSSDKESAVKNGKRKPVIIFEVDLTIIDNRDWVLYKNAALLVTMAVLIVTVLSYSMECRFCRSVFLILFHTTTITAFVWHTYWHTAHGTPSQHTVIRPGAVEPTHDPRIQELDLKFYQTLYKVFRSKFKASSLTPSTSSKSINYKFKLH